MMREREYRAMKGVSRSELWKLAESPEKYAYWKEHPEDPTPAQIFGQLVHAATLEPNIMGEEFVVAPEVNRRTTEGKATYAEFLKENEGKAIVSAEDWAKMLDMIDAQSRVPYVSQLLNGDHEKPFFWTDDLTGERCKVRVDCLTWATIEDVKTPVIVDYKTTLDASTDAFMRQAINLGYDLQAAMYSVGVEQETKCKPIFVFIAQEKAPPYAINIMQADPVFVRRGYDRFRELLGIYHECKESGNWYGYLGKFDMVNNLALPAWLAKEVE